jgi:hypothetical protein
MTAGHSANWEMAIDLPLGVVAHQLMKIEADLRLLNMKAVDFAKAREDGRRAGSIRERLENINEVLDSIKSLVSTMESDIQPASRDSARKAHSDRDD